MKSIRTKWLAFTLLLASCLTAFGVHAQFNAATYRPFEGDRYHVVEVSVDTAIGNRFLLTPGHQLGPSTINKSLVLSAGFSQKDCTPLGLERVEGHERKAIDLGTGNGNFYLLPNGVFAVERNGVRIMESRQYRSSPGEILAFQSGPLMIHQGIIHPAFQPHSPNMAYRSAVGLREHNGQQILCFVMSADPVRFHAISRFMKEQLGCDEALMLGSGFTELGLPYISDPSMFSGKSCRYLVLQP
jgi:uncharacterized protein YigE (DUF2233 family)